jgi:hypothetical protein
MVEAGRSSADQILSPFRRWGYAARPPSLWFTAPRPGYFNGGSVGDPREVPGSPIGPSFVRRVCQGDSAIAGSGMRYTRAG